MTDRIIQFTLAATAAILVLSLTGALMYALARMLGWLLL